MVEILVNDICAGMECAGMNYDVDEEEDVLIHFKENATEIEQRVWDATICAKTKEQLQ